MDSPVKESSGRSLKDEISSYFLDNARATDIVGFWQVICQLACVEAVSIDSSI